MSAQHLPASFNALPDHSYPLAAVADGVQLNGVVVGTSETLSSGRSLSTGRTYRAAVEALLN